MAIPLPRPLTYEELLKAYRDLDENAKVLVRTDLELHKAKSEVDSQVSKLLLLNKLSDLIHTIPDHKSFLKTVCESLVTDLNFEKAWILYKEGTQTPPLLIEYGASPGERPQLLQLSEQAEKVLKNRPDQVRFDIDAQDQDPLIRGLLESIGASEMVQSTLHFSGRSYGGIYVARLSAYPALSISDLSFFVMLSRQISIALENNRMHAEILQNNQMLEQRVTLRSKELTEANTRLMELDQVKSNFISLVSHELRTPMTAIKGFASLILEFEDKMDAAQRRQYLLKINEESDRLSRLIGDLLNISRIESGKTLIRWSRVNLEQIIVRVIEQQTVQKFPVKYVMEIASNLPSFAADPDKLEQVILNLVTNASRFTPPGKEVRVHVDQAGEDIRLQVINPGEGISFVELAKIFDKFYRVENDVNRRNRGTGLGLSICRGLVSMHGGRIWAESEVNRETVFTVLLPLNLDKLSQRQEEPPASSKVEAV